MKKLLLTTAAAGVAFAAAPAYAQIEVNVGGYFKGYGAFVDQDEDPNNAATPADDSQSVNDFDIVRDSEIHIGGETTLDNGLTVGVHLEMDADGGDSFNVEENYAYFSGGWGRVNFGAEDGSAYLLQVSAPSADSNIDGIRQYINPVNYNVLLANGEALGLLGDAKLGTTVGNVAIDYDQNVTAYNDKLTYLSPILNGFQIGVSYTPDNGYASSLGGIGTDDVVSSFGEAYEGALRYEGQFNNVGVIAGAGYTHLEIEATNFQGLTGDTPVGATDIAVGEASDDRTAWNVGLDLDFGPFGIGAIYKEDDFGEVVETAATATEGPVVGDDEETFVIGVDYTTGPFKLGASYMDVDNTFGVRDLDTTRYSGGVTYTYGPGMTFRGSIGYIEHELAGIGGNLDTAPTPDVTRNDVDSTYVTIGTQINF